MSTQSDVKPQTSERFTGTVKWYDPKKGYGFITRPEGSDKDVFVHANTLPDGVEELEDGQEVTYQTEASRKGVRAVNVLVVK